MWIPLNPLDSRNTDFYMRALRDITEGAEPGVFSYIMAQKIMAMEASIKTLESEILRLRNPANQEQYIELNGEEGVIKSSGFISESDSTDEQPSTGYRINSSGDVEFANGVFGGFLKANGGILNNVIIGDTARLGGSIINDKLIVDFDPDLAVRFPVGSGEYPASTPITTLRATLYSHFGYSVNNSSERTIIFDNGIYRGFKVLSITFISRQIIGTTVAFPYEIIIRTTGGTYSRSGFNANIGYPIWLQLGSGGRKLKILDLDQSPGNGGSGTVFKYIDPSDPTRSFIMVRN